MRWPSSSCRAQHLLGMRSNVVGELKQNARHLRQCDAVIDRDVLERARRHVRAYRVARILDDSYTAMALDFVETGRAVVETAGQHDADHARSIGLRGAG